MLSRSACCSDVVILESSALFLVTLNAMNSTMITAPSMMMPKSMAPKLIKLASTPKMYISESANNKQSGITDATTNPDLKFPSNRTTTKITIKQPRMRFSVTVKVVLAISSLRSKKALIYTPSGKDFVILATRSFTASITFLELASFSIMTCPRTFSPSPLPVMAPNRVALPKPTLATSFIYMGTPPSFLTTIFSISSREFTKPSPLIKKAWFTFSI